MTSILEQFSELQFEQNNTFNNGNGPCYYSKTPNGYVVFFIFPEDTIDFAVYDKTKKLISLVTAIDQSLKEDWQKQFVKYTIQKRINQ